MKPAYNFYISLRRIGVVSWLLILIVFGAQAKDINPILQSGHTDDISYISMSEEEDYLITGGMDEKVIFWDVNSRQQVASLSGFKGGVSCLAYNTDSNILVVGTYGNQVQIYDLDIDYYNPQKIYDFVYHATSVAISPDGSVIMAASADYTVNVIKRGREEQFKLDGDVAGLSYDPSGLKTYLGTYKGGVYKMTRHMSLAKMFPIQILKVEQSISDMSISNDGKLLAIGCAGVNSEPGSLYIYDIKKDKLNYSLKDYSPYTGVQNNTIHFTGKRYVYYKNNAGGLSKLDIKKKVSVELLKEIPYSGFYYAKALQKIVYAEGRNAVMLDPSEEHSRLIFKGFVDIPVAILGQDSHVLFVEYESGIKSWDLKELEVQMVKEKFYEDRWVRRYYSSDLSIYAEGNRFNEFDGKRMAYFSGFKLRNSIASAFSQNNRYYAYMMSDGSFNFADLSLIHPDSGYFQYNYFTYYVDYPKTRAHTYNKIVFAPHKNEMVLLGKTLEVYDLEKLNKRSKSFNFRQADFALPAVYNPHDGYLLTAVRREVFDSVAYAGREGYDKEWRSVELRSFTGNTSYKNIMNGVVYLWDLEELSYPLYFVRDPSIHENADVMALVYDPHDSSIITGYSDGNITVSSATDTVYKYLLFKRVVGHGLKDIRLSSDGSLLFVTMSDGRIDILRKKDLSYICALIALEDNEYVVMNAEGYYKRSKNTADAIAFWQNGSLSKLSQFDQMFNKPHKVMQGLGFISDQKLSLIKRLSEHSDKGAVYSDSIVLPKLKFLEREGIEYTTSNNEICFKTQTTSESGKLDYMKIWVNGVPLYTEGEEPKAKNSSDWKQKWDIPLQYGENLIKLKAYTKSGVASNEIIVNIKCTKPYIKPDLYIAMISVSKYKDSSRDLKYAVKDGRDMANVFVDESGKKRIGFPSRFGAVHVDSFFDENATREKILRWKEKLQRSKPEDYVVLYVSGHGLLDDELDFWFATHDIDFGEPAKRGLSYDELEGLLVAIPARQKLFLMDACHSGEVIKEELMVDSSFVTPDGSRGHLVGYTHRGMEVIDLDGEEVNRDDVKQQLFSNYISSSGATVISAAAGSSFALESPEWNNGIFTYTVIGGLLNRWADLNQNGEVSVVELSKYVSAKVKEQTDGMQIPNDRQENIENNFRIW